MERDATVSKAMGAFERLTGLAVCLVDQSDVLHSQVPERNLLHGTAACATVKSGPWFHRCHSFHDERRMASELRACPEGRIQRCHAGFIEWVVPVMLDGAVQAFLYAGQRLPAADLSPAVIDPQSGIRHRCRLSVVGAEQADDILEALRQLALRLATWLQAHRQHVESPSRAIAIRALVARHHTKPISRADLGKALGLSPDRAAHVVRETTGSSWLKLLREARLATACRLLAHSDQSVAAVALSSGFGSQAQFQRLFKAALGSTPQEWRRRGR